MPITFDSLQKRRSSPWIECRNRGGISEGEATNVLSELHVFADKVLEQENNLLTLPTILTLGRVTAIPILITAITDWLDGYLARKMGTHSSFGAFLDPVADKLMVATTLVLLSTKPLQVSWAVSLPWLISLPSVAIIGREITMSAVREWAASQDEG